MIGVSWLKLYPGLSPAWWLSWGHIWLTLWALGMAAEDAWYWGKLILLNIGYPVPFLFKGTCFVLHSKQHPCNTCCSGVLLRMGVRAGGLAKGLETSLKLA